MQENKTQNIEVKTIGAADIAALTESEHQVFLSAIFNRIVQLAERGERI